MRKKGEVNGRLTGRLRPDEKRCISNREGIRRAPCPYRVSSIKARTTGRIEREYPTVRCIPVKIHPAVKKMRPRSENVCCRAKIQAPKRKNGSRNQHLGCAPRMRAAKRNRGAAKRKFSLRSEKRSRERRTAACRTKRETGRAKPEGPHAECRPRSEGRGGESEALGACSGIGGRAAGWTGSSNAIRHLGNQPRLLPPLLSKKIALARPGRRARFPRRRPRGRGRAYWPSPQRYSTRGGPRHKSRERASSGRPSPSSSAVARAGSRDVRTLYAVRSGNGKRGRGRVVRDRPAKQLLGRVLKKRVPVRGRAHDDPSLHVRLHFARQILTCRIADNGRPALLLACRGRGHGNRERLFAVG